MLKRKTLLPPEDRKYDVGWTDDDRLVLCFKYFAGSERYDGYFPLSFFDPPLVTLVDLECEIVKHFGWENLLPNDLEDFTEIDILKRILVNEFEYATT